MTAAIFAGQVLEDASGIIARYPQGRQRSAIMPLLYLAQAEEGMVTREAMGEVAELLGITSAEVEAVASFYTMYRLHPTGEHLVNVCTNLACLLRGGKDVYEAAHRAAGTAPGQDVSDDGLVTVHEEECLGVCDFAPAVQIDLANHDEVTPDRVADLIAQLRAGEVPAPSRGPVMMSFRQASRVLAGVEEVPVS
jgi:NADH-quinone oxidoreductase subunit E